MRAEAEYYNDSRTHGSLEGNSPIPKGIERTGVIIAKRVLERRHHRYSRVAVPTGPSRLRFAMGEKCSPSREPHVLEGPCYPMG